MDCEVIVNRHDMYISLYISLLLGELTPSPAHRHALYGSRRVTEGHWLCTASMATHAVLGVCMSLTEALCLSVTSTGSL